MKKLIWMALLLGLVLPACSPRYSITNSWKARDLTPKSYKKIVVLGLLREQAFRQKMEMHIVDDLKSMGYEAICSCDEYDPKAFEGMDETQAIEKLKKGGIDAVLTIVMLDKEKERYYVPTRVMNSPYYVTHNRYWLYYHNMYDRVGTEGYFVTNTRYFWESNFYDLATDKLLYSAQSTSFDPNSAEELGHAYGQLIVKNLVKNNIISTTTKAF
jgi:hypothetical protein